jgi:hypothetical protein
VAADAGGAVAVTSMAGTSVPSAIELGQVTTSSRTGIEDGLVVARSRTQVATVSLLSGLIELRDVVTDVVAATDGHTARTDGGTTIGGASVLGVPVTVGRDEVTPVLGSLLGLGTGALDAALASAGIHISLAPLQAVHDGASARVAAAGIEIGLDADGSDGGPLSQLLALLPSDQLPGDGLPGVPVNTSPQALVNLLKETHLVRIAVGPATAGVDASPGFTGDGESIGGSTDVTPTGGSLVATGVDPGFTTPLPGLTAQPTVAHPGRSGGGLVPGRAIGALVVVLAALSLPLWAAGSARLMDATLADAAPGCVEGFDGPSTGGGARGDRQP